MVHQDNRNEMQNDGYLDPYRDAVKKFGPTFEASLWKGRASQIARFDVLISMVDLTNFRLLDAGCAIGDLAIYLAEYGIAIQHYIGLDGLPSIIESAQKRAIPKAEFHTADFVASPELLKTGKPDVIYFSGSLNTLVESDARYVIASAFEIANVAVVFNFLSDRCTPALRTRDTTPATRFSTEDWLSWAFKQTSSVSFQQGYLKGGHDATIAMFKADMVQRGSVVATQ